MDEGPPTIFGMYTIDVLDHTVLYMTDNEVLYKMGGYEMLAGGGEAVCGLL